MKKAISERKLSFYLVGSALILFFIADGFNKYFQFGQFLNDEDIENSFSLSIYLRFVYEAIFLFIILFNLNFTRRKIILTSMILISIFFVGHITFILSHNDPDYSIFHHFTLLNKYLFAFIIFGGIYKIVKNWQDYIKLMTLFENIVVINSILIFAGIAFNINLLKSYYNQDDRYGYDGLFPSVNEATLFYFIAISYFYYKYFINGKKDWKIWMVIASSLLLGTKAIYLCLLLLFIYHIVVRLSPLKKIFYLTTAILIITFLIVFVVTRPDFAFLYASFSYFYEKEGFLYMITSGRSSFIEERFFENLSQWNFINYLFGGTNQFKYMIEMDFFDLFLFSGLIGSVIMFVLYAKTIFKNEFKIGFFYFFSFCYFLFAFLTGHIFASATNALNLILVCLFLRNSNHYFSSTNFRAI